MSEFAVGFVISFCGTHAVIALAKWLNLGPMATAALGWTLGLLSGMVIIIVGIAMEMP